MIKLFDNFPTVYGELSERLYLNTARLTAPCYRASAIYTEDQLGWPGDWEGRTILALVSQWNAVGAEPAYLDEIIRGLPEKLNEKGYLGTIYPEGVFNEQQLSGHNWLTRGLMEYWKKTGDDSVRQMFLKIVKNLYLPLRGMYHTYPLDPSVRGTAGSYGGNVSQQLGSWYVSTDIGCAFMCFDCLGQAYEITADPEVLALLSEMTEVFSEIDFVGAHMQTHATLSAIRGILRTYEASGDGKFLSVAKRIFDLYVSDGMTENYANFNWFGRFDTWTEPCAIVDSLMAALTMFRMTEEDRYLALAQRIYYNALCHAQRLNGGFGLDTTVGPKVKYLKSCGGLSEAYWCCTMRGAEGLSFAAKNLFMKNAEGDLLITFGTDAKLSTEDYTVKVESEFPYGENCRILLTAKKDVSMNLRVFLTDHFLSLPCRLKAGETGTYSVKADGSVRKEKAVYLDGEKYFRGNLLLGQRISDENGENPPDPEKLLPLTDVRQLDEKATGEMIRKIAF